MTDPRADPGSPTELRAVKLIGGGRALAHAAGSTWMVKGALPGELVLAQPTRRRARIIEASTIEVLGNRHPARLEDPCPHAPDCGGCDWPHVDAKAGSKLKITVAAEASARFPDISARLHEAPIVQSPPAYRLRSRLHWDPSSGVLGFYEERSRRVCEITHCRIISPILAAELPGLHEALAARCPSPVDLEIIVGGDSAVAALRPARGGPRKIDRRWLPKEKECRGIAGFHGLTTGSRLLKGWGQTAVHMDLPVRLEVPVGSFFQGNRHLVPWLFDRVTHLVGSGTEPVFDLHGGVGFLAAAAWIAGRKDVTIVEPHAGAAEAARRNLPMARVLTGTAEAVLAGPNDLPGGCIVITDPPRAGMTRVLRGRLIQRKPRRVVMLGCDPATWSRDTAELLDNGYAITHLELVDLFPFTHHVEILAVLELR